MFFAYSEPEKAKASDVQIMIKTNEGGKWNTNIIKKELSVHLHQMCVHVAPTYINLEKPTFWLSKESASRSRKLSGAKSLDTSDDGDREARESNLSETTEKEHSNHALNKVLKFT